MSKVKKFVDYAFTNAKKKAGPKTSVRYKTQKVARGLSAFGQVSVKTSAKTVAFGKRVKRNYDRHKEEEINRLERKIAVLEKRKQLSDKREELREKKRKLKPYTKINRVRAAKRKIDKKIGSADIFHFKL